MKKILVSASLMCADLSRLADEVKRLEDAGVDYIHYDVMDGHFVPNFGLGLDFLTTVRRLTRLPVDTHLMIETPEKYIRDFAGAGSSLITVHVESTQNPGALLNLIRGLSVKAGIAINPGTPVEKIEPLLPRTDLIMVMTVNPGFSGQKLIPSTLEKINALGGKLKPGTLLGADGNVSFDNAVNMVQAGANFLVGGSSSLFNPQVDMKAAVKLLKGLTT